MTDAGIDILRKIVAPENMIELLGEVLYFMAVGVSLYEPPGPGPAWDTLSEDAKRVWYGKAEALWDWSGRLSPEDYPPQVKGGGSCALGRSARAPVTEGNRVICIGDYIGPPSPNSRHYINFFDRLIIDEPSPLYARLYTIIIAYIPIVRERAEREQAAIRAAAAKSIEAQVRRLQ